MSQQPTKPGTLLRDTYALATTHEFDDEVLLHRSDCPKVHELAEQGHEVHSLFGCLEPFMPGIRQHDCLKKFGPGPTNRQKDASKQSGSKIKRFTLTRRLSGEATADGLPVGEIPIEPICDGAEFADGRVAVRWHKTDKLNIWPSLKALNDEIGRLYREAPGFEFGGDVFWDDI